MPYEEEDTYHMRRRIHTIIFDYRPSHAVLVTALVELAKLN